MRINQIGFIQQNNKIKTKISRESKKILLNQSDSISFSAKKPLEAPKTPETTLDWALHWDKQNRENELNIQYEKALKEMSFWKRNFTDAPQDLKAAYAKTLEKEEIAANTLIKNSLALSQQQKDNILAGKANEAKEAELKTRAQKVEKLEQAVQIASAFKIPDSGCLDDNIAGYSAEKEIIRNVFVRQIADEKAGLEAKVPNSMLLYGAIGTGKTTFTNAIAEESDSELIELSVDSADFAEKVNEQLKEARQRYLTEGRRTIIQINEAEIHLEEVATNKKNIAQMKSWLDRCAELPKNDYDSKFATTFLFTTNYPLDISDEILYREEKLGQKIALEPAAEGNIEAIIRFYIEKFDKEGTLINPDTIDFEKIIQKMNPDDEKGAFGNDKIKKIVELACSDFNQDIDNKKSFEEHLNSRIDKAKRNIFPNRLKEYKEQLERLCEE